MTCVISTYLYNPLSPTASNVPLLILRPQKELLIHFFGLHCCAVCRPFSTCTLAHSSKGTEDSNALPLSPLLGPAFL